ncbi:hypothetical protein KEM52_002375 [Ascosphaera acerosa]|nr:hypothetical protein KEM52_002375 [Ascosphaera acerosa]
MSLLHSLEQISQSAESLGSLRFPPPKAFTNALLRCDDITTLIRDTEPHERALFSIDPAVKAQQAREDAARRRATLAAASAAAQPGPGPGPGPDRPVSSMASRIYAAQDGKYRQSAVARVLGGDMMSRIRRSASASGVGGSGGGGGVDVELLLQGAEMLCKVYPVPGAQEQIEVLRAQYAALAESLRKLEEEVELQAGELESRMRLNVARYDYAMDDEMEIDEPEEAQEEAVVAVTDEDIRRELEAVRELEMRKAALERRMSDIDQMIG